MPAGDPKRCKKFKRPRNIRGSEKKRADGKKKGDGKFWMNALTSFLRRENWVKSFDLNVTKCLKEERFAVAGIAIFLEDLPKQNK